MIKMKPADVQPSVYIGYFFDCNDKDPKFKVGNHVKISKYTNILRRAKL